jgi:hypothetical protein
MDMQAVSRARAGKEEHCTEHRGHHEHGRQGHQGTVQYNMLPISCNASLGTEAASIGTEVSRYHCRTG